MGYDRVIGYTMHLYRSGCGLGFTPLSEAQYNKLCDTIEKRIQAERRS